MANSYVHGYEASENERLRDQAETLAGLLHQGTAYPPGSRVLEAGCGVGAQTVHLAVSSPEAEIVAMDLSEASLDEARARIKALGRGRVSFVRGDILHPQFAEASFDHVFACFVLEHLPNPESALLSLKRILRPGGTLTVIEGDHGSTFFHPHSEPAMAAVRCQILLQERAGGDANIGRRLHPLLAGAGFRDVAVSPRMVYVDGSRPDLAEGFTLRTFTAMIEGVRTEALTAGLLHAREFDRGIRDLKRAAEPDGVFCYTFFKGMGRK